MSREPFDRNKPHMSIEEIAKNNIVTPDHAAVTTVGWERMNTHEKPTDEASIEDYNNIPTQPEERETGFAVPKHR